MTRFLSAVAVSATTGLALQICLILFTLVLYFFVSIYVNRFWRAYVRKEVSLYEQIIFFLVVASTLIQCVQCVDPFSMNGVFSFRVNRVFFLVQGSLVAGPASLLLMDCLVVLLLAVNKKQSRLPKPYRILSYATIAISVLTAFPVFVGIATNAEWADEAFLFHLITKFIPILLTIALIYIALKIIADNEADTVELNAMSHDLPTFEKYESNPNETTPGDQKETTIAGSSITGRWRRARAGSTVTVTDITIEHANERIKKGLREGIGQLIAVMGYLAMDLIDGHHVLSGEYFLLGMLYGFSSRFGVVTMLRMNWIAPVRYDAQRKMIQLKNRKIFIHPPKHTRQEMINLDVTAADKKKATTAAQVTLHECQNTTGFMTGFIVCADRRDECESESD